MVPHLEIGYMATYPWLEDSRVAVDFSDDPSFSDDQVRTVTSAGHDRGAVAARWRGMGVFDPNGGRADHDRPMMPALAMIARPTSV